MTLTHAPLTECRWWMSLEHKGPFKLQTYRIGAVGKFINTGAFVLASKQKTYGLDDISKKMYRQLTECSRIQPGLREALPVCLPSWVYSFEQNATQLQAGSRGGDPWRQGLQQGLIMIWHVNDPTRLKILSTYQVWSEEHLEHGIPQCLWLRPNRWMKFGWRFEPIWQYQWITRTSQMKVATFYYEKSHYWNPERELPPEHD